jgi:hypothetical protein
LMIMNALCVGALNVVCSMRTTSKVCLNRLERYTALNHFKLGLNFMTHLSIES